MERKKLRIGLLIDFLVSEYSEYLIKGVQECCNKVDADFYIFQMGELQNRSQSFDYQCVAITAFLSENNIDGLLFVSATQTHYISFDEYISYLNSYYPLPIVNISGEVPGIPSVVVKYDLAYRALIEHLVRDVGAKKIGLMSVDSHSDEVIMREQIFWQVMKDYGIPFDSVTVWKAKFSYSTAMYELNKYEKLQMPFDFDAIVALNDDMAIACLDYAKKKGISVPKDLIVTGFDDLRKASFYSPSLSTVNQMVFQQGYIAARTLYDRLLGKDVPMLQEIDCKAILRHSTDASQFFNKIRNNTYIEIDRAALSDIVNNNDAAEWYQNRTQIYRMTKMHLDMQTDITEEEMVNHLTYNLQTFGISYIVIVAFDEPIESSEVFDYFHLPHKASVLCCFDKKQGIIVNTYSPICSFDPNEIMIPANLEHDSSNPILAMSLYTGKYQYGYMLIEKSDFDIAVYDTLKNSVSLLLSSLYHFKNPSSTDGNIKEKFAVLDKIAHTDELTGLMNRRGLMDFGQKALELAQSLNQQGMIIFGDMDGLKKINDNFGHDAGDKAIIAEASILKSSFRSSDFVARISGDEFVIISNGLSPEYFEKIKEKINQKCIEWTEKTNSLFLLSISLGYVAFPYENCYDLTVLLAAADSALYNEKRLKKQQR